MALEAFRDGLPHFDQQDIIPGTIKEQSWFKPHPLALVNQIQTPLGIDPSLGQPIEKITHDIYLALYREYVANGCPVIGWSDRRVEIQNNTLGLRSLQEAGSNVVAINPVFLGRLPNQVMAAMGNGDLDLETYKSTLREHLPESRGWVYAHNIGSKKMHLTPGANPGLHPHFTNMIFIEDNDDLIRNLPHERILIFMRMMMAKVGAFKNIIVPYKRYDYQISYDTLLLGTMEGGHPKMRLLEDLAERLMAFGSSEEVGGQNVLTDVSIDRDDWENHPVVQGMIAWGQFLGARRLLSPPVSIQELTKSRLLSRVIEELLRWYRQAEGAFFATILLLKVRYADGRVEQKFIKVVSNSGTSGAIKDKLKIDDISAVLSHTNGKVNVVPVRGLKPARTSVEAEEFLIPLDDLPKVEIGGIEVPALRAGFHIHRGLKRIKEGSNKVFYFMLDFPHVGCGVKTMQEMSKQAMQRAVEIWEESGRKAQLILVYVPNHGTNGFIPWSVRDDGTIPENPYEQVQQLMEEGEVEFTDEVPQDDWSYYKDIGDHQSQVQPDPV